MDQADKSDIATFHFAQWLAVLCMIVVFAPISSANAAEAQSSKRVLLISTGSRFSAGFALVQQRALEVLEKTPSHRIETDGEDLDIIRFPAERFQRLFGEYLAEWPLD